MVNIFAWIVKDFSTVASKVEQFLAEVEQKAPAVERIASSTLLVVGPVLQTLVSLYAGAPAGAAVGAVIQGVQTKLAAVSGLISSLGATPTVATILQSAVSDLSGIDTLVNIQNPTAQANLALVLKELSNLASLIPAIPVAASVPAPVPPVQATVVAATPAVESVINVGPGLAATVPA
jgi:hypothetical protein